MFKKKKKRKENSKANTVTPEKRDYPITCGEGSIAGLRDTAAERGRGGTSRVGNVCLQSGGSSLIGAESSFGVL